MIKRSTDDVLYVVDIAKHTQCLILLTIPARLMGLAMTSVIPQSRHLQRDRVKTDKTAEISFIFQRYLYQRQVGIVVGLVQIRWGWYFSDDHLRMAMLHVTNGRR